MQLSSVDIHHTWLPATREPKAVFICVHGIGLHGGCYHCLGESLSREGYAVLAIDVRGLGCWKKWGEHPLDLRGTILDLQRALNELRRCFPGLPLFLGGESMGAAIALKCASLDETLVDGLILSSPAVDTAKHYFNHWELWLKYYIARGSRISLVKAVIERAAADDQFRNAWINDPLATTDVYARDLVAVRNLVRDNERSARMIKNTPALVLQGYNDRLFCPRNTLNLYDELATRQKEMVYIGDAEHLMLQSRKPDHRCLAVLGGWMDTVVENLATRHEPETGAPYCELYVVRSTSRPLPQAA